MLTYGNEGSFGKRGESVIKYLITEYERLSIVQTELNGTEPKPRQSSDGISGICRCHVSKIMMSDRRDGVAREGWYKCLF